MCGSHNNKNIQTLQKLKCSNHIDEFLVYLSINFDCTDMLNSPRVDGKRLPSMFSSAYKNSLMSPVKLSGVPKNATMEKERGIIYLITFENMLLSSQL
jgi:hypothetical protein